MSQLSMCKNCKAITGIDLEDDQFCCGDCGEEFDKKLRFFEYKHLPENLQKVSRHFGQLAKRIVLTLTDGPERTVALRKLLEAKDAAVRAEVHPGA